MSEFTKEELQYLLEMIDSILIVNRPVNDDELQEKLKAKINYYCDHSFLTPNFGIVEHCTKCSKLVRGKKLDE